MEIYTNELFAPPVGLELETELDGEKFYSSDKLKTNFLLAFEKSSRGKHIHKEIKSLVEKGFVVPCFKSKNLLKFFVQKFSGNKDNKYILAFYHIPSKRVFVLIDNNISLFGTASNNELTSTTMHECMHLASARKPSKFVSVFFKDLQDYYSSFLSKYFSLEKVPKKEIGDFIKYISKYEIRGPTYANKDLSNYFKFMYKTFSPYTKLDQKDFEERLVDYTVAAKLFIVNAPSLFKASRRFSMIFTSLNQAYQDTFGEKNTYTTPIQELISYSEVACVLSEMKPKHPSIQKLFRIIS